MWHAADQWKFIAFSAYLVALFLVAAGKDMLDETKLPPPSFSAGAQPGKQSAMDMVRPKHSDAISPRMRAHHFDCSQEQLLWDSLLWKMGSVLRQSTILRRSMVAD